MQHHVYPQNDKTLKVWFVVAIGQVAAIKLQEKEKKM